MQETRARVVLAFAAVYLIWGSTYLAIKFVIEEMPALLTAGIRFIVAGLLLWALAPGGKARLPTGRDWSWAFLLGGLLFLGGNGAVVLVEAKMPTGVTALLITSVPLWMVLVEWATGGAKPQALAVAGLLLGFGGVGLLASEDGGWEGGEVDPLYVGGLLLGCLAWAIGSVLSRRGGIRQPILRSVALQMAAGGLLLTLAGLALGDAGRLDLADITWKGSVAWVYLVLFGSIVAFTAYSWLLSVRPSAMVSTYAFVNPVVAVALGALVLGEPLGPRTLLASVLILAAVALVIYAKSRKPAAAGQTGIPENPGTLGR